VQSRPNFSTGGRTMPRAAFTACALIALATSFGCDPAPRQASNTTFSTEKARAQKNDENLTYALSLLRNVETSPSPETLTPIVTRLNQWGQDAVPIPDWKPDSLLTTLPPKQLQAAALRGLAGLDFPISDGRELVQVIWLNKIAHRAAGESNDSLAKAQSIFDWVVRNIQIEADDATPFRHGSTEILLFGKGTAADRAWLFSLLARQQGLNVVMLALPGKSEADEPKLWLPALLDQGELYLFDPRLGLPIAGVDGKPVATLAQVIADPAVLRAMDADEQHLYPLKSEDLHDLTVYVEGTPVYLSHRMQLIEAKLGGDDSLVLSAHPEEVARQLAGKAGVGSVRLWPLPYERLKNIETPSRDYAEYTHRQMAPFQQTPALWQARMLDMLGKYEEPPTASAMYQEARPSDASLSRFRAEASKITQPQQRQMAEFQIAMMARAKQDASYWLGLLAFERASYDAAIDYLKTRVLEASPDGPWTSGARYNLGRAYEADGNLDDAIRAYESDHSPQRSGNLLRAKRLKERAAAAAKETAAHKRNRQYYPHMILDVF